MSSAPTMPLDDVIEVLRSVPTDTAPHPTTAQVRILVDDIWGMQDLSLTAARPELSQFSELDLLAIAENFGKHRARVLKQALAGKRVRHESEASGMLFPPAESEVRAARVFLDAGLPIPNKLKKKLRYGAEVARSSWGTLPGGYDRMAGHGRDVHVSLAALLAQPIDDAEIIRFVDRTYSEPTVLLDGDHVRLLHWLASRGLAGKLLDIPQTSNAALVKLMVQAYDLLEVTRSDAVSALGRVVRAQVEAPAEVRAALVTARWLAPGPIGRLIATAERSLANPANVRLAQIFPTSVRTFCHTVRSTPEAFIVRDVASLSEAHLTQILTLSGLDVDDGDEKAAANELRSRLIEMGLRNDLDRELPQALRAWRSGRLEDFYASRTARVSGDPDWASHYESPVDADMVGVHVA